MNRDEYLDLLKLYLENLPSDEIEDILSDYREHFNIGISKGKSEQEISKELGSPKDIAANYKSPSETNYSQNESIRNSNDNTRKLLIGLLLIFFNLVMVLGPFMAIVGVIFSLYLASFSMIIGGIALIFGSPFALFTPLPPLHILTSASFGIGLIGLGILGVILLVALTKLLYGLIIKYFNWNIELTNK